MRHLIDRLEYFSYRNRHLAVSYRLLLIYASASLKRDEWVVYTMGKVGSRTIVESLNAINPTAYIFHIHALTPAGIESVEKSYKNKFSRALLESQYLRQKFDQPAARKYKVITLVRDPIAKNVSSFFQNMHREFRNTYGDLVKNNTLSPDALQSLLSLFLEQFHRHHKPLNFFDVELGKALNIDVYQTEFPKTKGYQIYRGDRADLLVIKLEHLNACAEPAFREFLGIEGFKLVRSNEATSKQYSEVYQQFLKFITLPQRYLDQMYGSTYAQHFYTEEEIHTFMTRWSSPR